MLEWRCVCVCVLCACRCGFIIRGLLGLFSTTFDMLLRCVCGRGMGGREGRLLHYHGF